MFTVDTVADNKKNGTHYGPSSVHPDFETNA